LSVSSDYLRVRIIRALGLERVGLARVYCIEYACATNIANHFNSTGILTLLAILCGMGSARAYACVCKLALYSALMAGLGSSHLMAGSVGSSGNGKKPGQAAVQVNIVGRDGTIGPPLLYSTTRAVSRPYSQPDMAHEVRNDRPGDLIYSEVSQVSQIMLTGRILGFVQTHNFKILLGPWWEAYAIVYYKSVMHLSISSPMHYPLLDVPGGFD